MAKALLICGKICSGKSTYSIKLEKEENAVLLSVDEIMLSLFPPNLGDKHDEYARNTQKYLFNKSIEIIQAGTNVILDWGFWTKADRSFAREFYQSHGIACEMHYLDISDELWNQRLAHRNQEVTAGKTSAYYVDENLAKKFESLFEKPNKEEIDIWLK